MKTKSVVLNEFKQLMSLKYSANTISNYLYYVEDFFNFSDKTPTRVTNEGFLNYNIHLVKNKVSDSTRNVAINAVKLYFSLYLKTKVKQHIAIRPKLTKKVVRHLEHNFIIEKLESVKNSKAKLILSLGYGCGLRTNEVLSIKRSDINLKERFIIVNGKGRKQRKLPISDYIIDLIIVYGKKYRPVNYLFNGKTNENKFKEQYSAGSILALVKKNIGNYRFHDLRHSFAMRLYLKGVSLEAISKLLGHSKTETTEIYAYSSENTLLEIDMPL